jgi:hypothetical protein
MNFEIEHAGKAVFSSTGTFSSLSAKPKHFVVTIPAASLYAQLIPGNLFLIVSKSFMVVNPVYFLILLPGNDLIKEPVAVLHIIMILIERIAFLIILKPAHIALQIFTPFTVQIPR